MKKIILCCTSLFLIFSLFGCSKSFFVNEIEYVVFGEELKIELKEDVNLEEVVWSTEDENILTVDKEGNITTIAVGTTNVIVTVGKSKDICTVTVKSDFKLSYDTLLVRSGQVREIAAFTKQNLPIMWNSSNEAVATVSYWGEWESFLIIEALAAGQTIITATMGNETLTCVVTVE